MPRSESKFQRVYLLHGRGGSPNGTVLTLEAILVPQFPGVRFERPALPHGDATCRAETSFDYVMLGLLPTLEPDSLIVGVSLGGLLAAKMQELAPQFNFSVMTFMSPTEYDAVQLIGAPHEKRVALYSSLDPVIKGRCDWTKYATQVWDVDWLREHDLDRAKWVTAYMIGAYLQGKDLQYELDNLIPIKHNG